MFVSVLERTSEWCVCGVRAVSFKGLMKYGIEDCACGWDRVWMNGLREMGGKEREKKRLMEMKKIEDQR